jgi:hypothetical protein
MSQSIFTLIGLKTKEQLATKLNLAGGTLTGALNLHADPTANLQAATKQYVDAVAGTATNLGNELDATQAGAGLEASGAYAANSSTNYLQSVTTLKGADEALDTKAKSLDDAKYDKSGGAISGDVSISGTLTVSGATTTVDTTNLDVKDSIINLGSGAGDGANATNDGGLIIERGSTEDNAAIFWDEGTDLFKLATTSSDATATDLGGTSTLANVAVSGLQVATVSIGGAALGNYQDFLTAIS